MNSTARIAVMFDRFGPYHAARLRGAASFASVLAVEAMPSRSVYAWDPQDLPLEIERVALIESERASLTPTKLRRRLDERVGAWRPDALALPGWSTKAALVALDWAFRRGIPAICMSETNEWDFERSFLRERLKAALVAHYAAGLVTSDSQARYLERLGLAETAIARGYNVVDNDYFQQRAASFRAHRQLPQALVEAAPNLVFGRFFLASARFIEKKNLEALIRAYAGYRSRCTGDAEPWGMVLLGDGALRPRLEAVREELGLESSLALPGFMQLSEICEFYGSAGAFVHASSTEQWGLVVNEAMAAGLPVAVSARCGCVETLVEDGVSGFVFNPHDVDEIEAALRRLAELPGSSPMRCHAANVIAQLNPQSFGRGLFVAASSAQESGAGPSLHQRGALRLALRVAK